MTKTTQLAGFEPPWKDPNSFQFCRLNQSANTALSSIVRFKINSNWDSWQKNPKSAGYYPAQENLNSFLVCRLND